MFLPLSRDAAMVVAERAAGLGAYARAARARCETLAIGMEVRLGSFEEHVQRSLRVRPVRT